MKRLMLIIGFGFSTLLLFSCALVGVAAAHVLKTDNGISGVLHIEPDDNPQAGQPTVLDESFGDVKDVFSLQDCNCQLIVEGNSQAVQTFSLKPAVSGATLEGQARVRFPDAGTHSVIVKGNSKDGKFSSFRLDYPVSVGTGAQSAKDERNRLLSIGGAAVIVGLGAYGVINLFRRGKEQVT